MNNGAHRPILAVYWRGRQQSQISKIDYTRNVQIKYRQIDVIINIIFNM